MTVFALNPRSERSSWIEINTAALQGNIATLRGRLPDSCRFMAVVKGNAYGHGSPIVARLALECGAAMLGVATVWEGSLLRAGGITAPIVILSPTAPEQARMIVENDLTPAVSSLTMALALTDSGCRVHVKVNTGMNRCGLTVEDAPAFLRRLREIPGLTVEGVFSHLAGADEIDRRSAYDQFALFTGLLRQLSDECLRPPLAHIANSAAIIDMPEMALDMVRGGIALYGLYPSRYVSRVAGLSPVLAWKATVMEVRRLQAGDSVSYGGTYVAEQPTTIALLPIGYADGYRRMLSGRGEVLIRSRRCRVAGRVCMDLTVVDCGDLDVTPGDEAVLIGRQGDQEITADEMADWLHTINYEVTTQITERVPRLPLVAV